MGLLQLLHRLEDYLFCYKLDTGQTDVEITDICPETPDGLPGVFWPPPEKAEKETLDFRPNTD